MNAHNPIRATTKMTSKGQVLIPKNVRDQVGLVPGSAVNVGVNDRGEAVLTPVPSLSDDYEERIHASIMSVAGTLKTGKTTDEMMRELRGDDPFL